MGIFGNSSPFDQDVERATSENNTNEEWGLILEICDRAGASAVASRDCLRAVLRRLAHPDPHVQVHAATLLDACVANCGRFFHLETAHCAEDIMDTDETTTHIEVESVGVATHQVNILELPRSLLEFCERPQSQLKVYVTVSEVASREFETEFRRLVSRAQPPVAQRLRAMLRKWAEGEFRSDPQLDLIPALCKQLRAEASEPTHHHKTEPSPGATAAAAQREQDELARAIALSLRESAASGVAAPASSALYPRVDAEPAAPAPAPTPAPARKVRALYDFEAAEDNELTFLAGEIVHVTDSSDPNWWKGYNERGEGLFPANFVTADLSEPQPKSESRASGGGKSVQFAESGAAPVEEPPAEIDEACMDAALAMLHDADVEARGDEASLSGLESRVVRMGPLVDAALERADTRHARLTQLSAELVRALNLYHELMRDPARPPGPHHLPPGPAPGPALPPPGPAYLPQPYPAAAHPPPPRC